MEHDALTIGDWLLEPRLNRLSRDGRAETLEPLAAEVLAYLAAHAGEVVSADKLTETLWPRRFVGDSPVYRIMADLRRILGDDARAPRYIETIRKRGYRLIADVAPVGDAVSPGNAPAAPPSPSLRRYAVPGGLAAALAVAVALVWLTTRTATESTAAGDAPTALSVAVLPFLDLSAARDNEHIGDGIAEALIHQLAQVPDMRVIARNSSFTFKGASTDVREIGRALNVEAVLEGSVQRARDELRVTAQLVDARTGMHIWSRQFDRNAGDIFAVQDEIALAVLAEVTGASPGPEASPRSAEVTDDLDAYDFYLLGRARLRSRATEEARQLFARALEIDPDFALAHTGIAEALLYDAEQKYLGMTPDPEVVEQARAAIDRALESDPDQIEARASRVLLAELDRNWAVLDEAFAEAVERGPGYALTYYYYADALTAWAIETFDRPRFDRALQFYLRARSLDPLNPLVARSLAFYHRRIGQRAEAMAEGRKMYDLATTDGEMLLALDSLALLSYELGEPDRAVALARLDAAARGELTPSTVHLIAETYYHLADLDRAAQWFDTPIENKDQEYLGYKARLAVAAGDTAQFEALVDQLLNDPPPGVSPDFALSDVMFAYAEAGQCERIVAVSERISDSVYRDAQPASDLYAAACHAKLSTGEGGPFEERIRRYLSNQERFGDKTRIGLLVQSGIASVLRDREKAIARLGEALDIGFVGVWWLEGDVPYEALATDERYIRLIDEAKRQNATTLQRLHAAEASGDWCGLAGLEPKGALISTGACVSE